MEQLAGKVACCHLPHCRAKGLLNLWDLSCFGSSLQRFPSAHVREVLQRLVETKCESQISELCFCNLMESLLCKMSSLASTCRQLFCSSRLMTTARTGIVVVEPSNHKSRVTCRFKMLQINLHIISFWLGLLFKMFYIPKLFTLKCTFKFDCAWFVIFIYYIMDILF